MTKDTGVREDIHNGWSIPPERSLPHDNLVDCLLKIATLNNLSVSRTTLSAGLPLVNNRLTVELFPRAASRAGLSTQLRKKSLADVTPLEMPAILLLQSHRAGILVDYDPKEEKATLLLPEAGMGEEVLSREELEKIYTGYAFFLRPKFKTDKDHIGKHQKQATHWFLGKCLRLLEDLP